MTNNFTHAAGKGLRLARSAFFGSSLVLAGLASAHSAAKVESAVDLATAASYAVLADSAVTNSGNSVITGDVGIHPGTNVSGFPPGAINGTRHIGDAAAQRAQSDLTAAYDEAAGRASSRTIGPRLERQTLTPGVYKVRQHANLAGTLTLDAQGNPGAVFIIQVDSTLTTAENSGVRVVNSPRPACSVFWTVRDSAILGANTSLVGRIMAVKDITLQSAAKLEQGGALSRDGAVTLDTNAVSRSDCAAAGTPTQRPTTAPASPTSPGPSQTGTPAAPAPVPPGTTAPGTTTPETGAPVPSTPELTVPPPAAPSVPEVTVPPPAAPGLPAPPPAAPGLGVG
ncbi:ice-binding family protein [Micromonospora sp. NPDC005806]|uniref:ice-binding family protein n=1 Tax=Micromonospora sp. NPDC005806 TaxID=3364234 RepID=UPI00368D744C